jgi:hypothetical protein
MRSVIHAGWVIALAACGGGGPSGTTRAGTTTEPPQVAAARAKRDAVCACTDEPCVNRALAGPLGREVETSSIEDPATLRLLLGFGHESLECMYRISGIPAACLAMVRTGNALSICPALTEEQGDSVAETMRTTEEWSAIAWRALSAEQVREYERLCGKITAAMRDLAPGCAPQEQPPGAK